MKKGLVVSVGGSRGAYAGGIVEYYIRNGKTYDNFYGSSIGSLIIPYAATGNYNQLKMAFSQITMDDVFTLNPFKIQKQNKGIFKYSINHWNVFKNLVIRGNSTLGDSKRLRTRTIPKFFPETEYINILNNNKNLMIMVTNISTGEIEQKHLKDYTHDEFMDWMYASACAPPFMSIAEINGNHYTDGGILNQVPLKQAIIDGCDEIDVIVLAKEVNDWPIEHIRNFFHYQIKLLMLMMNKIKDHQIDMGYLTSYATKKIQINFHYTKRRLTNNALLFDGELMSEWWTEGYEYTKRGDYISYVVDGKNKTFTKI